MEALLGDGRADLLARMMMGEGKIFPAFMDMLVHEKWPVRLGGHGGHGGDHRSGWRACGSVCGAAVGAVSPV